MLRVIRTKSAETEVRDPSESTASDEGCLDRGKTIGELKAMVEGIKFNGKNEKPQFITAFTNKGSFYLFGFEGRKISGSGRGGLPIPPKDDGSLSEVQNIETLIGINHHSPGVCGISGGYPWWIC